MSDEVMAAQKRGRSKVVVLAAATAVVGAVIGTTIGQGLEKGKRQDTALTGAAELAKEIDAANGEIEKLADVLKNAKTQLSENKYPEKEIADLGGINIPFEGSNLSSRGIGLFKREVISMLVRFAGGSADANAQKDKLKAILGGNKKGVVDFLEQNSNPKVRWSLYVANGPHGPWATMQQVPTPFPASSKEKVKDKDGKEQSYSWPEEFKVQDGQKMIDLPRYTRGDPMGSEPKIIPVDPSSASAVCPSDVLIKLRSEIGKLETVLRGDKTPGQEEDGLIDTGRVLVDQLKAIGGPG
jgi:hypothetical protein